MEVGNGKWETSGSTDVSAAVTVGYANPIDRLNMHRHSPVEPFDTYRKRDGWNASALALGSRLSALGSHCLATTYSPQIAPTGQRRRDLLSLFPIRPPTNPRPAQVATTEEKMTIQPYPVGLTRLATLLTPNEEKIPSLRIFTKLITRLH